MSKVTELAFNTNDYPATTVVGLIRLDKSLSRKFNELVVAKAFADVRKITFEEILSKLEVTSEKFLELLGLMDRDRFSEDKAIMLMDIAEVTYPDDKQFLNDAYCTVVARVLKAGGCRKLAVRLDPTVGY